ncbi:hypothetical protein BZA70DRAFT_278376 [Myxozyma melibiosi]|uniref:Uncharacterized protein n=1 Tax=Myxozyma melibiosi TaxID=54550 RepID=A0ABR1F6S5_9ASCO
MAPKRAPSATTTTTTIPVRLNTPDKPTSRSTPTAKSRHLASPSLIATTRSGARKRRLESRQQEEQEEQDEETRRPASPDPLDILPAVSPLKKELEMLGSARKRRRADSVSSPVKARKNDGSVKSPAPNWSVNVTINELSSSPYGAKQTHLAPPAIFEYRSETAKSEDLKQDEQFDVAEGKPARILGELGLNATNVLSLKKSPVAIEKPAYSKPASPSTSAVDRACSPTPSNATVLTTTELPALPRSGIIRSIKKVPNPNPDPKWSKEHWILLTQIHRKRMDPMPSRALVRPSKEVQAAFPNITVDELARRLLALDRIRLKREMGSEQNERRRR